MEDEILIDQDMLIALVEERPVLWDKNMDLYKNRQATQLAWEEITMALNPELASESDRTKQVSFENLLRKKWRYLRDQFSVERGKIPDSMESKYKPRWPFFKSLLFLKDIVHPRRSLRRGKRPLRSLSTSDRNDDPEEIPISFQTDEDSFDPLEQEEEKPLRKKAKSSDNVMQFAIKKQECEESNDDENEHLYFFRSLLPHIKLIPRHHVLSFRSRIQEIVEEYAYAPRN